MGRKYKGDNVRFDSEDIVAPEDEVMEAVASQYRPPGIDPETSRRAQAIALRQLQARIPSFY